MTTIIKDSHIVDSDQDRPKSSLHFYPTFLKIKLMFYILSLFVTYFVKSNAFGFPKPKRTLISSRFDLLKNKLQFYI